MKQPYFELKMKTDIAAFERELKRFARLYIATKQEDRLTKINIGEWGYSLFDTRATDETHHPVDRSEARGWSVTPYHQSQHKEWIDDPAIGAVFWVSNIGGEYPLLLKISPFDEDTRPFVKAFVERCEELWGAIPVKQTTSVADARQVTKAAQPPTDKTATAEAESATVRPRENSKTWIKIGRILKLRNESIRNGRVELDREKHVGDGKLISDDTMRANAPSLLVLWEDPTFNPTCDKLYDMRPSMTKKTKKPKKTK